MADFEVGVVNIDHLAALAYSKRGFTRGQYRVDTSITLTLVKPARNTLNILLTDTGGEECTWRGQVNPIHEFGVCQHSQDLGTELQSRETLDTLQLHTREA